MSDDLPRDARGRRLYSDAEIAQALALLDVNAGNVQQTANALDIPEPTLRQWARGDRRETAGLLASQVNERIREEMAERFQGLVWKLLDVVESGADDLDAKAAMIAAAVGVDKMLLLRGEATQITENRSDESETRTAAIRQRYAKARVLDATTVPPPVTGKAEASSGEGETEAGK